MIADAYEQFMAFSALGKKLKFHTTNEGENLYTFFLFNCALLNKTLGNKICLLKAKSK